MNRIIGIDYGKARVGVAISDPLKIIASPVETVPSAKIIEYLQKYARSQSVELFVVGWPLNLNGTPAQAAEDVERFLNQLRKAFPEIPVSLEDERFSTVLAHRAMIDGGMKKSQRRDKNSVDRISAAIILQSYLDKLTKNGKADLSIRGGCPAHESGGSGPVSEGRNSLTDSGS